MYHSKYLKSLIRINHNNFSAIDKSSLWHTGKTTLHRKNGIEIAAIEYLAQYHQREYYHVDAHQLEDIYVYAGKRGAGQGGEPKEKGVETDDDLDEQRDNEMLDGGDERKGQRRQG